MRCIENCKILVHAVKFFSAQIEPYHCRTLCSLGAIRKSKRLDDALSEADYYATLTNEERLGKLEYTENYVKVKDTKLTLSASNSQPSQAEKSATVSVSATGRKRRLSSSNTAATQVLHPLKDRLNIANVKPKLPRQGAQVSDNSVAETHINLFSTLGIGFNKENSINLITDTLVKQIKTQVIAALNQHTGMAVSAKAQSGRGKTGNSVRVLSVLMVIGFSLSLFTCGWRTILVLLEHI